MTVPFTFGWAQAFLLLLAIAGFSLLTSAAMSVRPRRVLYEDKQGNRFYRRHRGHFRIFRFLEGSILVIVALAFLWLSSLLQTYIGMGSEIKVAQVKAMSITNMPHTMIVELTLYDQDGKQASSGTYSVPGDRWFLQGDVLRFPDWLNIVGLHSGYKLTRLQGEYDSVDDENKLPHKAIELNGGDGDFFKTVYKQQWSSPFVQAAYGNALILPADGHTYNVYISQTGLTEKPVS